ncbi:MAG TPA: glutathione S-transferase family protein [Polyangiales bacterium]|nr:glutathione S-transferase family protein [Polyangiales bacterium]
MSLKLHYHPLASYCWKALIALYEHEIEFDRQIVDLADREQHAALRKISPFTKFPALEDRAKGRVITESTLIIEYLARHYPGRVTLVPADPDAAFDVRRLDRFFDLYVHEHMQKIVGDKIRPEGKQDPFGVEQARATLATAYDVLERELGSQPWAAGDRFSLADCAAAPALYYANRVAPFGDHPRLAAYLERLHARASFARTFEEAQPYMKLFPG